MPLAAASLMILMISGLPVAALSFSVPWSQPFACFLHPPLVLSPGKWPSCYLPWNGLLSLCHNATSTICCTLSLPLRRRSRPLCRPYFLLSAKNVTAAGVMASLPPGKNDLA